MNKDTRFNVAVIGAGPAGIFAAEKLSTAGHGVVIFNRDIKPGGMMEYGIFPDKRKLKDGLRCQVMRVLSLEDILYFGNLAIGKYGCLSLDELMQWGFGAILVACGAQGTKRVSIPGEGLGGVYHAKELVYHYNHLPPFSTMNFEIGKRVAIIGVGNVAADVAHYLVKYKDVDTIHIIGRRGPAEVKFSKAELEPIINSFDFNELDSEFKRVEAVMRSLGQDPESEKAIILSALAKACPRLGNASIRLRFLCSPREIIGNEAGRVTSLELEENGLEIRDGVVRAVGTGSKTRMNIDTLIFAIGDKVDEALGLPVAGNEYHTSTEPHYPVEGISYEVGDAITGEPIRGLFVAGWSRVASNGLVGAMKKDGIHAAIAIENFLEKSPSLTGISTKELRKKLAHLDCVLVEPAHLGLLDAEENRQAEIRAVDEFKFSTNEEMLSAMGLR